MSKNLPFKSTRNWGAGYDESIYEELHGNRIKRKEMCLMK